jgi:TPR repeat protein
MKTTIGLAAACLLAASLSAAERWVEVKSPHFTALKETTAVDPGTFATRTLPPADALAWRADLHAAMGRREDARRLVAEARALEPAHPMATEVEALLAWYEGKVREAPKSVAAAVENGTALPVTLWVYGAGLAGGDEAERATAEKALVRAHALQPDFAPAALALARLYVNAGRELTKAEQLARGAVAAEPGELEPLLMLASTLYAQGRAEEAKAALGSAHAISTSDAERERVQQHATMLAGWSARRSDQVASAPTARTAASTPADGAGALEEACAGGVVDSCVAAAYLLRQDGGGRKDVGRSAALATTACDQGSVKACALSAWQHENGEGVAVDLRKATTLYAKACEGGDPRACGGQGNVLLRRQLAGQAVAPLTKACDAGHPEGCHLLGEMHRAGYGVAASPALAKTFFKKACDAGLEKSCAQVK